MRPAGTRAAPMPPDLRRAAIVDAAIPLLRCHGATVTTKQIADAAGIAEGTIFRVFADKEELVGAAVTRVFDQAPTIAEIRRIDRTLPLRDRMRLAVEVITARLDAVWELMAAMRMMGPPDASSRARAAPADRDKDLADELAALLAPDADQLRVSAAQTARLLRLVTFAGSHPRITNAEPLTSAEIVDLLLDGLRAPSSKTSADSPEESTC